MQIPQQNHYHAISRLIYLSCHVTCHKILSCVNFYTENCVITYEKILESEEDEIYVRNELALRSLFISLFANLSTNHWLTYLDMMRRMTRDYYTRCYWLVKGYMLSPAVQSAHTWECIWWTFGRN